jgi:hypothetical protein
MSNLWITPHWPSPDGTTLTVALNLFAIAGADGVGNCGIPFGSDAGAKMLPGALALGKHPCC